MIQATQIQMPTGEAGVSSDTAHTETPTRSVRRVVFLFLFGGIVCLGLLIMLIALFSESGPTPLELQLLGRWSRTLPAGHESIYTFHSDGNLIFRVNAPVGGGSAYLWNAHGTQLWTSEYDGWLTDLIQSLTGTSNPETYEVLFHDENTIELHSGTPTGEVMLYRIVE